MLKKTKSKETAKPTRSCKRTNDIIEDYGDWLLVDISTPKHPDACMAVDKDVFVAHEGGRISTNKCGSANNIYAIYWLNGGIKALHRDVIDVPDGMVTDHKFHYPCEFLDNRRSNLRAVTRSENGMNSALSSNNTSGVAGIYWQKASKKWVAHIMINRKNKYLGYFTDKSDAIAARKKAEEKYFGEYAYKGASK